MKKADILKEFYPDEELLIADGFDDAILGVTYNKKDSVYIVVYSRQLCIEILMNRDKMTYEEATEYFDFNVEGAYVGEKTPIYVDDEGFNEAVVMLGKEPYSTFDDIEG